MSKRGSVSTRGLTKALLIGLGTGAVIGAALLFPQVGYLYREFEKEKWNRARKRGALRPAIKRLERQNLISWRETDRGLVLTLTENGRKRVLSYQIDDLSIKRPKKWDGHIRIVIFDIPEKKRRTRDIFRKKIQEMGFFKWQKSVFVYPFECKDEIDFLRHSLEIGPYVQYILAREVPGLDVKFYRRFGLKD